MGRLIDDVTPERTFAVTGALGAGKTTGAAYVVIDRWLLNKDSQFTWCVAPTATRCEQIVLPALRQVLHEVYGMTDGIHYRIYRGKFYKLVVKGYQHEIHILSGDRPELFVGANISFFWVTEPGLMDRTVYEKLQARLRCPKAVVRQNILEGTPEGMTGRAAWWEEVGNIPGVGYDRLDKQRNIRRIILETRMNRWLMPSPDVYVEKLMQVYKHDPNKIKSYVFGEFVPFSRGSAYWEWVESRNITTDVSPSPHLPILLTFDFNVSPLAWVACQEFTHQKNYYSPREKRIIALAESDGEARGLLDAVADFGAQFPVAKYADTPIIVYGDASGWARNIHSAGSDYTAIEQYLTALGYRNITVAAARANPLVKHRLEKTAALMAYERHLVHERCRRLIGSYAKTSLKEGTFEIEKPQGEDWSHYADACTYLLYQVAKDLDVANPRAIRALGAV